MTLTGSPRASPSAISIRSSWLRNRGLTGVSMKATRPASMNHTDPQLSDTPTRCEASDPDNPDRISSKYRRFTPAGIRLLPPRGIRTSPPGVFATTTRNQAVYAAVFVDAVMVKVRDGQVANRPIYAAIGVSLAGEKDILGRSEERRVG